MPIWHQAISCINAENGTKLTELKDISNAFNDYYVNVGPNLAKTIGNSNCDYKKNLPRIKSHQSFFMSPTNCEEISNIIQLLKPKTSYGHDNRSPKVFKNLYIMA